MSTDGQPTALPEGQKDWPGREQGVPPPPSPEAVAEISRDQALITDEWAPAAPPVDPHAGLPPSS